MFVRAFAGFALAALCAFDGSAQSLRPKVSVAVENVYASGLLIQSGSVLGTNIVVGGYSRDRITLSGSYASPQDFLQTVLTKIGARSSKLAGVEVIAGNCAGSQGAPAFNPFGEKRLTLHFNGMEPTQILNMLQFIETGKESDFEHFPNQGFGLVGISVKNLGLASIYAALASASGVMVLKDDTGKLVASRRAGCKAEALASLEAPVPHLTESTCPRRAIQKDGEAAAKCSPLEFYKLENIVLRGRISVEEKAFALAETADGITWLLKPGDYLGRDFGRIEAITDQAVTVREIVRNPYGHYYEQKVEIDFLNRRRLILPP